MLIDVPRPESAWLEMRRKHIGGSEVAALIVPDQVPAYMPSPFALWADRSELARLPPVENGRTRLGKALEAAVADEIAIMRGWEYRMDLYATDDSTPGMGCTLDRLVTNDARGPGVLEIKVVTWKVYKESWIDGRPPYVSTIQLCHQMACTGVSWGAIGALILGGDHVPVIHEYTPRAGITGHLRRAVTDFWRRVRDKDGYPVDYKPSTSEALRAMFPPVVDEQPILLEAADADDICSARLALDAQLAAAKKERDGHQNRLIAMLEGHEWAQTPAYQIRKQANRNVFTITPRQS